MVTFICSGTEQLRSLRSLLEAHKMVYRMKHFDPVLKAEQFRGGLMLC